MAASLNRHVLLGLAAPAVTGRASAQEAAAVAARTIARPSFKVDSGVVRGVKPAAGAGAGTAAAQRQWQN